jgi:hypothetical protein
MAVGFFQPRSDVSDRFLTCGFSHDFLNMERSTVRILSWTLGIYGPKLFATHEDIEKPSGKTFNALLSLTNLTVVGDRRFPDEISFVVSLLHPYAAISGFSRGLFPFM